MLQLIRKYRTEFSVIFVVSSAGMVLTMFGNGGPKGSGGGSSLSHGVVAKVEGEEIQTSELLSALNRQMQEAEKSVEAQVQKAGNSPEARKYLEQMLRQQVTPDRVLQNLVRQKFLVTTAERAGMTASPEALRDLIQNMEAFRNKEGHFDPLLYRQMVPQPALFEQELAMQAKFESLRSAFYSGLGVISPAMTAENDFLNRKRTFETLSVSPKDFPDPASVDPKDVAAFVADPASKAKLQSYYERNIQDFQRDEQVHAKHILVREDEGGLKKIQEVLAAVRSGKMGWDAAAAKSSSDKSNASKGGDLGFFGHGMMDPAFEKAAFALAKNGDISEPVKSSFGYHLIQLVDRRAAMKRVFEEVQNEIAPKTLLEAKRFERAQAWLKGWLASGKVPSAAELKKYKLSWTKLPTWTPMQERLGPISSVDPYLGELLSLNASKSLLSQPISQGDSLMAIRLSDSKAAEAKEGASLAASEKVEEAFQFYLQRRFEMLEKNRKITFSEKTLSQLRSQLEKPRG